MFEQASMKQIRRWVSTFMWLRHNGWRWKTNHAGGVYTVAFDREEEKAWIRRLPKEYQDVVIAAVNQETERLISLSKRSGRNYSELLMQLNPTV